MRKAVTLAALVLAVLTGCRNICLNTNARVMTSFPPKGPLVSMPIEHAGSPLKIALVDVDGVLLDTECVGPFAEGENPVAVFREKLSAVAGDPCVRAVVVRINSHGGGVTASDIMRHDLVQFKARTGMPVIACLVDVGAGGAYYLATAADRIVAHPTTITGGIGVILNTYNLQEAMLQFNIIPAPVKSGQFIDMGSPVSPPDATPLDETSRQLLQDMANEFHDRFKAVVLDSRPQTRAAGEDLFDGRVFTASHAVRLGLVDEVAYLDDCIAMARAMAGLSEAHVVVFHRKSDPAYSAYDITPNIPLQVSLLPFSIPGFERARLPTFLYMWQPEPTMERIGGH